MDHPAYQSTQTPPNVSNPAPEQPTSEPQPAAASTPPHNPKSRNWKKWIIIGGITLIILLTGTAYVLSQQESKNQQTATKSSPTPASNAADADPTADWKTYINTKYLYSIKYPKTWELQKEKSLQPENVYFSTKSPQNSSYNAYFFISIEPNIKKTSPTKEWYEEWAKQIPAGISIDRIKFEETVFQGYPALKVNSNEIFFAKDNYMVRIVLTIPNGDAKYNKATESIFNQILLTFKFTDPLPSETTKGPQIACEQSSGKWLADYNECEGASGGLDEKTCKELGGVHKACDSACRHDPNAQGCIEVCINVCKF